MLYLISILILYFCFKLLFGGISNRNIVKITNLVLMSVCFLLFIRFGLMAFILLTILAYIGLAILSRNVDVNQFFKFTATYDQNFSYNHYNQGKKNPYNNSFMSREEAMQILGLSGNPSKQEIKKAYIELISSYHPDKTGGSDYFAKKINQARDVLLKNAK